MSVSRSLFAGVMDQSEPGCGLKSVTNSSRTTFSNCRKKYEYEYIRRLTPIREPVPYLVGRLFHEELAAFYAKWDLSGMRDRVVGRIESAAKAAMSAKESDKVWLQQAVVCGMLDGYVKRWGKKDKAEWKVMSTESSFSFKLPGGVTYKGKVDMVVKEKETGETLLVEHKTAAAIDAGYVARLPLDTQILGYAMAGDKGAAMGHISGVVYNVVRKSYLRLRESETFEQFMGRVTEDYVLSPDKYFYREKLIFSKADLDRFYLELGQISREMDRAHREGYFYRNTTYCTARGVCPYLKICVDGETPENMAFYRKKESVHEELEEKEAL